MDPNHNLLFGALALHMGLIDAQQFTEACMLRTARPGQSLGEILVEQGWMMSADKQRLDHVLQYAAEASPGGPSDALDMFASVLRQHAGTLHAHIPVGGLAVMPKAVMPKAVMPKAVMPIAGAPDVREAGAAQAEMRYTLSGLHGTGGIGRVWLGYDRHLDREVAIKELLPGTAGVAKIAARFVREARLTAQLQHPGIVPVYELATRAGHTFYTMRLVRGRTLAAAIAAYHGQRAQGRADPLEFAGLLAAFATVCNTIAYAHSRGVLHRDLKGDNVMLGDFGEVIVLDWGLAKLHGQADMVGGPTEDDTSQDPLLTMQGDIVGTPAYMAPEQAEGRQQNIDQRTDIYGLGAIFYEILCGRPPFIGANTLDVLHQAARGNPTPPHTIVADVPPALEEICLKAMARDPDLRFASAADLAQEVRLWEDVERRRAEDALRRQTELLQSILDSIPGIVWTARADGWIDYANQFWFNFTGLTLEGTQGSGWLTTVYPEDVPRVIELWTAALHAGEPVEVEYRIRRAADGVYVWFLARGRPLRDHTGQVVKWFGMLTEIHGPKQSTLDRLK